jgi:hypothetical protein
MEEEQLVYDYLTGSPRDLVSGISRKISAYSRSDRVRWFKIGITNNPEVRFWRAHIKYYDKMIVVYRSQSINSVSELEDLLVEHNRDLADNLISGGGGNYGEPPYFLYVVLKYLKKRG